MARKKLSGIRETVRQFLRDEDAPTKAYDFADDELDLHVAECLVEISQRRPYELKETVVSDGTKAVDISTIEDLLEVERAEYPVDRDPPAYRDVSVFGDSLRLQIDMTPTSGDNIYLYCYKLHELTESGSSLSVDLEKVLVEGVVAKTALAWVNQIRVQIGEATDTVKSMETDLGHMTARIAAAQSDLTDGRPLINKINIGLAPEAQYGNYAARELQNAMTYLNRAGGYFRKLTAELSAGAAMARYQAWANGQYMIYQGNLAHIAKRRVWQFHPKN